MFDHNYNRAAVAAGAQLLDQYLPGWYRYIKTDDLRLYHPHLCVLGQLAHRHPRFSWAGYLVSDDVDYMLVRTWLQNQTHEIWRNHKYGFDARRVPTFRFLRKLWTEEVNARLAQDEEQCQKNIRDYLDYANLKSRVYDYV